MIMTPALWAAVAKTIGEIASEIIEAVATEKPIDISAKIAYLETLRGKNRADIEAEADKN